MVPHPSRSRPAPGDRVRLARELQEVFTAVARLRANRQQVSQVETFRDNIKRLLSAAHDAARRAGYSRDDVKSALYAVTVLVDESVLNSADPALAGWGRQPLQEEVFGGHTGGQVFFEQLRGLLQRPGSAELADVLEVFHLCLLLGFQGRYATADHAELRRWRALVRDRLAVVRGAAGGMAPDWAPPTQEAIPAPRDAWTLRLAMAFAVAVGGALALFVVFSLTLHARVAGLRQLLAGLGP